MGQTKHILTKTLENKHTKTNRTRQKDLHAGMFEGLTIVISK